MKFMILNLLLGIQSLNAMTITDRISLSNMPLEVFAGASSYLGASFTELLDIYRVFYPASHPLEWEEYNPLAVHDATADKQAALVNWLKMPLDAPEKQLWLKQLMKNPSVHFNHQTGVKYALDAESVPSVGYYPIDRFDPDRITELPLAITQVIQMGDKKSALELLSWNVRPDFDSRLEALRTGDLEFSKRVFEASEAADIAKDVPSYYLLAAIQSGNINVVKFIITELMGEINTGRMHQYIDNRLLTTAGELGSVEIVKYIFNFLQENDIMKQNSAYDILYAAACKGNYNVVKYLMEERNDVAYNKPSDRMDLLLGASESGSVKTISYLVSRLDLKPTIKCLYGAVSKGSLQPIKYFVEDIRLPPDFNSLKIATEHDNLIVLRYLVKSGYFFPWRIHNSFRRCLHIAVDLGFMDIVRYFIEECHVPPSQRFLDDALDKSNISLIKYLLQDYGLKPSHDFLKKVEKIGNSQINAYLSQQH